MFKRLSICALFIALGMGLLNAQQREAMFKKIEVPNADFDLVIAMAKPGGPTFDIRNQPDPYVVYLMGGQLVSAYLGETQKVFKDIGAMLVPACAFRAKDKGGKPGTAAAIYVVPKSEMITAPVY